MKHKKPPLFLTAGWVVILSIAGFLLIRFEPLLTPLRRLLQVRQASGWSVQLGEPAVVPNPARVPVYPWFPDGHIAVLKEAEGNWSMFWAEFTSYRTRGTAPFPEDQVSLDPFYPILGSRGEGTDSWENGGTWLMSVFRLPSGELAGFAHAEDHWNPPNPAGIAWKSIAVTYSGDGGAGWSPPEPILTAWKPRPENPAWGGAGDHSVIWDGADQRWVCFYQELAQNGEAELHIAVSSDPRGTPGTWFKWDGRDFTQPGLGGKGAPLPAFWGREGGNPSVHWNTYLHTWIMVYGGWDGSLYISSSPDLLDWSAPKVLVSPTAGRRAWYPTILSSEGDAQAGQTARLYYADIDASLVTRRFTVRTITFQIE